ncbi:hypothetical protein HGRIS_013675 [Hohenbuehelia grisea]|uniref:CBM21 domain-containing protein n=1 Tax=Hohenbuehelia grisea TaxID=104357 RepID=A0ABR3IWA5_9AGAR
MIATLSATSQIRARPPMPERSFTLSSNSAGSPLPLIPRRTPSRAQTTPAPTGSAVKVVVHESSPARTSHPTSTFTIGTSESPDDASETGSPTASDAVNGPSPTPRVKKQRRARPASPTQSPPEQPASAVLHEKGNSRQAPIDGLPTTEKKRSPASHPMLYDPSQPLRINLDALKSRTLSASHIEGLPSSSSPLPSGSFTLQPPPLVRNKSGQLVKSSLKGSRPGTPGRSLTVMTRASPSKSEPTTPKAVHFDAQLEHVKLFLAEQKPLAVSRDGSPTDDTSGTESDFPSFIYGSADERRVRRALSMRAIDMPAFVDKTADVALEKLELAPGAESINGTARVRNIAFHKQLAVRFTLDSWQTTSEVAGRYAEAVDNAFDRFAFSIRLNDLARIESKTLVLALRYTVDGQELWDNNRTHNYHIVFSTAPQPREQKGRRGAALGSQEDEDSASDVADLKRKLERVVRAREVGDSQQPILARRAPSRSAPVTAMRPEHNLPSATTPTATTIHAPRPTAPARRRRSPPSSRSGSSSSSENERPLEFKTGGSGFGARYDLGSSLRAPWKANHQHHVHQHPPHPHHSHSHSHQHQHQQGHHTHTRMNSYPALVTSPSTIPWPEKLTTSPPGALGRHAPHGLGPLRTQSLGSPRDLDDEDEAGLQFRRVVGRGDDENVRPELGSGGGGYFGVRAKGVHGHAHVYAHGGPRNHSRGADAGGAHLSLAMGVRRTPPGTPMNATKALEGEEDQRKDSPALVRSPRMVSPGGGLSARSISFPPMDGSIFVSPTASPIAPVAVPPVVLGIAAAAGLGLEASADGVVTGIGGQNGAREGSDAGLGMGIGLGGGNAASGNRKNLAVEVPGADRDSEDALTPTFLSSSGSSRSSTPSPTEAFMMNKLTGGLDGAGWSQPADYHQFLDRFCFYTGADSPMPARPHGEGSVDDLVALTNQSPRLTPFGSASEQLFNGAGVAGSGIPRAASDDALACRSGSATPTMASAPKPGVAVLEPIPAA